MKDFSEIQWCLVKHDGHYTLPTAAVKAAHMDAPDGLDAFFVEKCIAIIPPDLTAMEMIRAAAFLHQMSALLLEDLAERCGDCDGCEENKPCQFMTDGVPPAIDIPEALLRAVGLAPARKVSYELDEDGKGIHIVQEDYRYDLTDVPDEMLDRFKESGVCLAELERLLKSEEVVYGG